MAEVDNVYMNSLPTKSTEKGMAEWQDRNINVSSGKQVTHSKHHGCLLPVPPKQHHVSLGIAVGCVILVCIVVAVFSMMTIQSHKSFIKHLTRIDENILNSKLKESTKITLFTRWGREDCPNTAELIYKGRTLGAPDGTNGSGSNYLCVTDKRQLNFTVPDHQIIRGSIFPTEYRYGQKITPLAKNHYHDVPCAVCQAARSVTLMMTAVTECPNGWTKEYDGYLMSGRDDLKRTEYICVDGDPSILPGTNLAAPLKDASTLFIVEAGCTSGGGVFCKPYENLELTCVVCTL
ncbi:uncharacterized protein [Antedon mediterranea]|uniref:uncharacterized protein n=1 Tax=Antedon mediterranea TaxID=105859 RepID=UPI003AF855BF